MATTERRTQQRRSFPSKESETNPAAARLTGVGRSGTEAGHRPKSGDGGAGGQMAPASPTHHCDPSSSASATTAAPRKAPPAAAKPKPKPKAEWQASTITDREIQEREERRQAHKERERQRGAQAPATAFGGAKRPLSAQPIAGTSAQKAPPGVVNGGRVSFDNLNDGVDWEHMTPDQVARMLAPAPEPPEHELANAHNPTWLLNFPLPPEHYAYHGKKIPFAPPEPRTRKQPAVKGNKPSAKRTNPPVPSPVQTPPQAVNPTTPSTVGQMGQTAAERERLEAEASIERAVQMAMMAQQQLQPTPIAATNNDDDDDRQPTTGPASFVPIDRHSPPRLVTLVPPTATDTTRDGNDDDDDREGGDAGVVQFGRRAGTRTPPVPAVVPTRATGQEATASPATIDTTPPRQPQRWAGGTPERAATTTPTPRANNHQNRTDNAFRDANPNHRRFARGRRPNENNGGEGGAGGEWQLTDFTYEALLELGRNDVPMGLPNQQLKRYKPKPFKRSECANALASPDGDDVECTICIDVLDEGTDCLELACGHTFHANCILRWLGRTNRCPTCRFEIPKIK